MSKRNKQSRAAIDAAINLIASDKASGAAEILRRAGGVFTRLSVWSTEQRVANLELAREAVIETCIALARAQPDMSPLLRVASAALTAARTANGAQEVFKSAQEAARNFIEKAERAACEVALHGATLIRDGAIILTHSRSSSVLAALIEAREAGRNFSVVTTESRPMLEGRALAQELVGQHIPVTLIADAAASLAMDQVNVVLMGADKITPVNLVNKIGTRMIALGARERGLPVYSLCDSSKFISEDYPGSAIRGLQSASELWREAPQGVDVVNRYFEPTPLACFTGIVTEDGVLAIQEAVSRAEEASIDRGLVNALGVLSNGVK